MYRQNKPDKFKYINELKQKHCYLDYRLYFSTYIEHLVPVIIALHNEGLWKRHGRNWESNIRNCVFNSPEHAEKLSNA